MLRAGPEAVLLLAGALNKLALGAHDYVYDVFPGIEGGR